jgi:Flp pilus assembly protein TadG
MRNGRWKSDRGGVSVMFAVGLTAVMLIIGLSVDGGGQIREVQRANDIAAEAARAGGQAIDMSNIVATPVVIDQHDASAAVKSYLDQAAASDGITISSYAVTFPDTQHITVRLKLDYHTAVLSIINVTNLTASGTGTAVLVLT